MKTNNKNKKNKQVSYVHFIVDAEQLVDQIRAKYWFGQGKKEWAIDAVNQFWGLPDDVKHGLLTGDAIVKNRMKGGKIVGHYALRQDDKKFKEWLAKEIAERDKYCMTIAGDFYIRLETMINYINCMLNEQLYKEFGDNILAGSISSGGETFGDEDADEFTWQALGESYRKNIFVQAEVSDEDDTEHGRKRYLRFKSAFETLTKQIIGRQMLEEKADVEAVRIANQIISQSEQRRYSRTRSMSSQFSRGMSSEQMDRVEEEQTPEADLEEMAKDENMVEIGGRKVPAKLVDKYVEAVKKIRLSIKAMMQTGYTFDPIKGMSLEGERVAVHTAVLKAAGFEEFAEEHHAMDKDKPDEMKEFNGALDKYLRYKAGDITGYISKKDQYKQSEDYGKINKYEGD